MANAEQNVYVNNVFDAEDIEEENVDDKSISSAQDNDEITATSHNTIMESTPNATFDNPVHRQQVLLRPLLLILVCILVTAVLTYFATKHICSENRNSQTECSTACGYGGTIYSQACFKESCAGDADKINMRFKRTGLFYSYYISDDDKTISNVKTAETFNRSFRLRITYRGTISDSTVDVNELIYYEVNYTYTVRYAVDDVFKILQVGIAECSRVYLHLTALFQRDHGWYWSIAFDKFWGKNIIKLHVAQNGKNVKTKFLSNNYMLGRKTRGQFKVFINTRRGEFTVVHNNDSPLYVFKEVKFNGTLCPIFGVFEPKYVDAQLKILNSRNFSKYPW